MLALGLVQITRLKIPPTAYWLVALGTLFFAFFKAWTDEHRAKEEALQRSITKPQNHGSTVAAWRELYLEKQRLEGELEVSIELMESMEPSPNTNCQPDDPGYFVPMDWETQKEYNKVSREAARIKEELSLIKEKLRAAPQIPPDNP